MKKLLTLALLLGLSAGASWADVMTFGWETGSPDVLGLFGASVPPMYLSVATSPVYNGVYSLQVVDNEASGTPQAYLAWIRGLTDGMVVTASFARYDITPAASPSCRIWAHWNDDPNNVMGYAGSASGNNDYGPGTGWDFASWSWTVSAGHTGLVIEVRTYSNPGDTVWIDDITVEAPAGTIIMMPDFTTAVEEGTWSQIKSLY